MSVPVCLAKMPLFKRQGGDLEVLFKGVICDQDVM